MLQLQHAMHSVLATIAVAAAPLDIESLSHFAVISLEATNKAFLGRHPMLDVPANASRPIWLHHALFRDLIIDLSRCNDLRFVVHELVQHQIFAENCLQLMVKQFWQDTEGKPRSMSGMYCSHWRSVVRDGRKIMIMIHSHLYFN